MRWFKSAGPVQADTSVREAAYAYVLAPDWPAAIQIVETRQRELLSRAADQEIALMLDQFGDDDANTRSHLEERRTVLAHCRRDGISATFADILYNVGNSYLRRTDGDLAGHFEQAIRHLVLAFSAYDRTSNPTGWASAAANAGAAYLGRAQLEPSSDPGGDLEQAIGHLKLALEEPSMAEDPVKRAGVNFNLGKAYELRVAGDRAGNLEQALAAYTITRMTGKRDDLQVDWGVLYHGLGRVYQHRVYEDRSSNIEAAIHNYARAMEELDRGTAPIAWAQVHMELAAAYQDRLRSEPAKNEQEAELGLGPRSVNLERAVEHYQQALTVLTLEATPDLWTTVQANLGDVYRQRELGDHAENLEQAIAHLRLASQGVTAADSPSKWAIIQANLGRTYARRVRGQRKDNLRQAAACYEQALNVASRLPLDELRPKLLWLGDLRFDQRDWRGALDAYERGIDSDRAVLASLQDLRTRRAEVGYSTRMYARAAYCCLQLDRPGEALTRLEQGKTRLLADMLVYEDVDLTALPQADLAAFNTARQRLDTLVDEQQLPPDAPGRRDDLDLIDLIRLADAEFRQIIHGLRTRHPGFMATSLSDQETLALIPQGGAIVALLFTSQGSMALVIPHGTRALEKRHVVDLKGFTDSDLFDLTLGSDEKPGWLRYSLVAQMAQIVAGTSRRAADTFTDWSGLIEQTSGRIWAPLVGPIHARLQELGVPRGAEVVLLTQGGSLLPMHAAWWQEGGQRRLFLDDYAVSYAPSAFLLGVAMRRRQQLERDGRPAGLYAVIDPTANLAFASLEASEVVAAFPPERRRVAEGHEATREAVLRELPAARYVHIASHGLYDWTDAQASTVALADGDQLSLADITPSLRLGVTRLVVLSACETGVTDVREVPDEYIGFPTAFLGAGAAGVLSSLWAVADISTALLLGRFYHHHIVDGRSPAAALRAAQRWLRTSTAGELGLAEYWERIYEASGQGDTGALRMFRYYRASPDVRPFEDPYFWAGFNFIGA